MTIDHREGYLSNVRSALSVLIYPLQYAANLPVAVVGWTAEVLQTRTGLMEENKRLRKEQLLISAKVQKLRVLEAENKRLRKILMASSKLEERVLIAELMAINLQPLRQQIVINKGSRDNVYKGQPLIDTHGIVGQISNVSPFLSTALLLTDPNHAIPVRINRNGLRAIAVGAGQNNILQLEYLSYNADILEGDLVVSSGLGKVFPAGYPVGLVTKIERVPGELFTRATVVTSARLEQSQEIMLVWPKASVENEAPMDMFAD